METAVSPKPFWWLKGKKPVKDVDDIPILDITSNYPILQDTLNKDHELDDFDDAESDIGSIIEEINKLVAKSPLGPYEKDTRERSVEDIMKEAEQIFMESSKSFEQLSVRSKTSANLSHSLNDYRNSTPSLKGTSPLPLDKTVEYNHDECYSDDFTDEELSHGVLKPIGNEELKLKLPNKILTNGYSGPLNVNINSEEDFVENVPTEANIREVPNTNKGSIKEISKISSANTLNSKNSNSLSINTELEKAFEDLKDARECRNALQLQLDHLNQTYLLLKISHDESLASNHKLNGRILECESILEKYKIDLEITHGQLNKLLENELNLNKLLEIEKLQLKSAKLQNEKDARCILDLNRQVKEMERIVARKHPDSVSALIVAAKNDDVDNNLTAKRFLEERVKSLESEAIVRDQQSSKIFLEVQEKFTEMKNKYESHIEDLELHVSDLKEQLKRKADVFEVYTQTIFDDQGIPAKETKNASSQTTYMTQRLIHNNHHLPKRTEKNDHREDVHLLATIRGLQADLANKEKIITKLQKEFDETKKTIRRLQKEREGSLKNLTDKKEFRSYPEKPVSVTQCNCKQVEDLEEELLLLKADRDKVKTQLCRIEEDYQQLKAKRLYDLSTLQQAHENEISTYISNITPLQRQLEIQQRTISLLEEQLNVAKLQTLENGTSIVKRNENEGSYHVHNPNSGTLIKPSGQKTISCTQCTLRQQQLIMYKTELDQLLETVQRLT